MAALLKVGNEEPITKMMSIMGADPAMNHGDFAYYVTDAFVESVTNG